MNLSLVIAGLDPAIHAEDRRTLRFIMDARVKPAHDETDRLNRTARHLNRNHTFRFISHLADKSRFFDLKLRASKAWFPGPLNQKVKP